MPKIQENGPYTFVLEFETQPAKAAPLIDDISAVVQRSFQPDRRFISASFHIREDGQRVLNYAQWTSPADYDAFMRELAEDANQAISEAISRHGARPLGGHSYNVRRIVERTG